MRGLTLSLVFLAACGTAREYHVDQVSDTIALVRVVSVKATSDATTVTLRYQAGEQVRRIGVHPPGHAGAFVITDADGSATYRLVKIDGVATLPKRTNVERGESREFTLRFAPIPAAVKTIHISEGEYSPDPGETSWQFTDVSLE